LPPDKLDWINTLNKKGRHRAGARILSSPHRKEIDMLSDVRNYYGLSRDFGQAGYFETEHSEQIVSSELKLEIKAGKLVALSRLSRSDCV
jgi:hypothetical protein